MSFQIVLLQCHQNYGFRFIFDLRRTLGFIVFYQLSVLRQSKNKQYYFLHTANLKTKSSPYLFEKFLYFLILVSETLGMVLLCGPILFSELPSIISLLFFRHVDYGISYPITSDLLMISHGSGWRVRSSRCGDCGIGW